MLMTEIFGTTQKYQGVLVATYDREFMRER